jgi:hypothetical protein
VAKTSSVRDDEKDCAAVEAVARQAIHDRLKLLIYSEPEEQELLAQAVEAQMADTKTWMAAGLGKPGLCRCSYPKSLLRGSMRALLRDKDCEATLLRTDWQSLPKHLCLDTAIVSTRHFATKRFSMHTEARQQWAATWPLPTGEASIANFAQDRGFESADLPSAIAPGVADACVGLWMEQHYSESTSVTLLGFTVSVDLSRLEHRPFLSHATVATTHAGRALRTAWLDDSPRADAAGDFRNHEAEWRDLDASLRKSKELLKWFESGALGINNELRGRRYGSSWQEEVALAHYEDAVEEMYRVIGNRRPKKADLLDAYGRLFSQGKMDQRLQGRDLWAKSAFYGWMLGDNPVLHLPPPTQNST